LIHFDIDNRYQDESLVGSAISRREGVIYSVVGHILLILAILAIIGSVAVGIAAAQGLAIAWDCELKGISSLALLAAGAETAGDVAAAVDGGHGELFVQQFAGRTLEATSELLNLPPTQAAGIISAETVIGPGANALVEARDSGRAIAGWPSAQNALRLPEALRSLAPKPIYARAPDARAKNAA